MLPPIDISHIADQLVEPGEELLRTAEEAAPPVEPAPRILLEALRNLLDTLRACDAAGPAAARTRTPSQARRERRTTMQPHATARALREATGSEPEALLEYGLRLLEQLAASARRLALSRTADTFERLALPLACWMLRRGTELIRPAGAVQAADRLAGELKDPDSLAELFHLLGELLDGLPPDDGADESPGAEDPRRLLLIDRANLAIRCRQPTLMVRAFETLVAQRPATAPLFLRDALARLDALDAPPQVRALIREYCDRWCPGQTLH